MLPPSRPAVHCKRLTAAEKMPHAKWRLPALALALLISSARIAGAPSPERAQIRRRLAEEDYEAPHAPQSLAPPRPAPPQPPFPPGVTAGSQCIRDSPAAGALSPATAAAAAEAYHFVAAFPKQLEARGLVQDPVENLTADGRRCWHRPRCFCDTWQGVCPHLDPSDWAGLLRPEFASAEAQAALHEAHAASVSELAEFLSGRTTLMVGDSVTLQLANFLRCDLVRLGFAVAPLPPPSDKEPFFSYGTPHFALWEISGRGLANGTVLAVLRDTQFHPPWQAFRAAAWADTTLLNYGLHIPAGNRILYPPLMRAALGVLADIQTVPGKVGLFRETSAQSFVGTGAFSGFDQARVVRSFSLTVCVALPFASSLARFAPEREAPRAAPPAVCRCT